MLAGGAAATHGGGREQEAIAALRNETAEPEETLAALEALRILVEPIDLANGAPSMAVTCLRAACVQQTRQLQTAAAGSACVATRAR